MRVPSRVTIVEVGPRDGFQMEKGFIPTERKVEIVDALSRTGVRTIECTSFVNPRAIPQMADAAEVMRQICREKGVRYTALVPNVKGAERAIEAGVDGLRLVVCATETYNERNVGKSIGESLEDFRSVLSLAGSRGVSTDAVIGLCFGCPLEGEVPPSRVLQLIEKLVNLGLREICIADSVGLANPVQVQDLMRRLSGSFPAIAFSLHFHDTRGLGLANVLAAMDEGVTTFDASIGGLGGCPVVPGATGNIATEDLLNMLTEMGVETGMDMQRTIECAKLVQDVLGRTLPSRVLASGTRSQLFESKKLCASAGN